MAYKPGESVIVTQDDVNHVGTVLDQYVVNKQLVYDVLLENRSALVMISTNGKHSFVNRILTNKLCDSGMVQSNIPYKQLIADDAMPMCRSYSAGKNSW
jgi:hypothetical protein